MVFSVNWVTVYGIQGLPTIIQCRWGSVYWAIQAGLLTPLTFSRHHFSSLAAVLLPVRTFFIMEGGDSESATFTLPTLKAFVEARSRVFGNKQ